ncbi:uncharacterized protein Z519_05491 [Cladophialophora bantiana CBS 173.52]|uniref:NAD-dependent epimerase/dehydratase domain-containing protein n=1 Tax=Cladophialophora bantiana (strain ATCC 10958 / CBS 173.52 / CDC B-1940 / NIH 8579) TaxID=1442370 RepID=A0A0D2HTK2_CLAB1|nr:uncharacterized protein Z519_05491 [Cladophialophora bantiana CBS 173.52]KIW94175.1 hypothetical protein Z519_05491 [Cladophialophora bantiana CBS 173.52]
MVRNQAQYDAVLAAFPTITLVLGDLGAHDTLREQCLAADIIVNCATSDDLPAITTIVSSLQTSGRRAQPVYFIHTSGAGIIDDVPNGYGSPSPNLFDDIEDIHTITSWPDTHWHRVVDKAVIASCRLREGGEQFDLTDAVKTAIICPPMVYGKGEGPLRQRCVQIPELVRISLTRGKVFQVNQGRNLWRNVHIADLADAYLLLIEEAGHAGGRAAWGADGYYFVENGEHVNPPIPLDPWLVVFF